MRNIRSKIRPLPCPFCGRSADIIERKLEDEYSPLSLSKYDVGCGNIGCYLEDVAD